MNHSTKTELELLKERADKLGVPYSNNIGVDTLRERVASAMEPSEGTSSNSPTENDTKVAGRKSANEIRKEKRKQQMELVRVVCTNMDPSKGELQGGIYSVSNDLVGTVEKFIPYTTDDRGYHIPRILLNSLKRRRFRQSNVIKDPVTGKERIVTKHIREFNFAELPPLSQAELDKVKKDNKALAELY